MIGIVDSGLGGVATCFHLRKKHPRTSFLVLADQKNAPYGDKTKEELLEIARDNIRWFYDQGIREVIIACNTLCSTVYPELVEEFPDMKLWNIIDLELENLRHKRFRSVLIMATSATIRMKRYEDGIRKMFPKRTVYAKATPKLVPMIEGGENPFTIRDVLADYLAPYRDKADAVLLGCTHYPLVSAQIHEVLPARQFDPNEGIEKAVSFPEEENPVLRIYTSHDAENLEKAIRLLFGEECEVEER